MPSRSTLPSTTREPVRHSWPAIPDRRQKTYGRWPWLLTFSALICIFPARSESSLLKFAFRLDRSSYVTLVLDDTAGARVRNLISEALLDTGTHNLVWNTLSDSILVDGKLRGVAPSLRDSLSAGRYRVRGLARDKIDLKYEFAVYNSGNPPWETVDGSGQWMADHTPAIGAVFDAKSGEVVLSSEVSESSAGLIWVNMSYQKTFEYGNVASPGWKCPNALAFDRLTQRLLGVITPGTTAQLWEFTGKSKTKVGDVGPGKATGVAVHGNKAIITKKSENQILLVDISATPRLAGSRTISGPKGCIFDAHGDLLLLADSLLLRCAVDSSSIASPETLARALPEPSCVTVDDSTGRIYVSIGAKDLYNIWVFDSLGVKVAEIGTPGPERWGLYDSTHMVRPNGLAIDSKRRLWVAESNYIPKRVSVWSLDGKLLKQFLGPTKYGGGGMLDPCDTTRFYYADERSRGSLEFKLDWTNGTAALHRILERWSGHSPQTPYCHDGKTYLTNEHQGYPTRAIESIYVQQIDSDTAKVLAYVGPPLDNATLKTFTSAWNPDSTKDYIFMWSDLNRDGQFQSGEIGFFKERGIAVKTMAMNDKFEFTLTTAKGIYRLPVSRFTSDGIPVWVPDSVRRVTSSTNEAYGTVDGATIMDGGPISGINPDSTRWTYPNKWLDVHGSWENKSPPTYTGEMIGVTKFLYNSIRPRNSDAGDIFVLNGNMGNLYMMTSDGLFVATLFQDFRVAARNYTLNASRGSGRGGWHMPVATRGMLLNDVSGGEEQFWPSVTQTTSGSVYCVAGHEHNSLVRVENLESIRRITLGTIELSKAALDTGTTFQLNMTYDTPLSARTAVRTRTAAVHVDVRPGQLLVRTSRSAVLRVQIYALNGSLTSGKRLEMNQGAAKVDLRGLAAGTYHFRVTGANGLTVARGTFPVVR